jgi:DNA-binding NarL/FixJ family response regulator
MIEINNLRLLIVADDPLARTGLAALMANQPGCTVVGQIAGDADLPVELDIYRPDVVLWDLGWGPTLMLEQLADLREIETPAVILLSDDTHAAEIWATGARGLLLRDVDTEKLLAALLAAAEGLVVLDPALTSVLFPHLQPPPIHLVEALTPRESEVLQLLAEGLPNKTIARRLEISEHTVKFHVNAIMSKLGAQSRTEAVVRATQLGLILL